MFNRKRVVLAKRHRHRSRGFYGLSVKDGLQFISSLILPLMLGIFTVVITFEQQKIARQQRLEDKNESLLQRKQEWDIAQMAQQAQSKAMSDQYQDEVLLTYIKEVADLLKENNGSLTSDPLTHTLTRVKTVNVLRQLDGRRQIHVIRFLYEAGQLTYTDKFVALDISNAELIDITVDKSMQFFKTKVISLAGTVLRNCSFDDILIGYANLSYARLLYVNFSSANFYNVNFLSATLDNVNFSSTELSNVNFSTAILYNINFSSANFYNVNFSSTTFDNVNFSSTELSNVNFPTAIFYNANFSSAILSNVNFSSAILYDVHFSFARFSAFAPSSFYRTRIINTVFMRCHCYYVNFSYADVSRSIFGQADLRWAIFHNANLTETNFSMASLSEVDLTNTTITDSQLESDLSIRNAKLPNGTLGRGKNLLKNGDANCNISFVNHWQLQSGNIKVIPTKENQNECLFALQSLSTVAVMSQRIALADVWDSTIWRSSFVELQAQMSSGASVQLSGKVRNGTIFDKKIANSTDKKISMNLHIDMSELEIMVKFDVQNNESGYGNIWCDNIELFIEYSMD